MLRLPRRWPEKPRRAASALISGMSPLSASISWTSRVSGRPTAWASIDPQACASSADKAVMLNSLVGAPFMARGCRLLVRRVRESMRPAANPTAGRSCQFSSDSAISSPSGTARTHRSMSWSLEAARRGALDRDSSLQGKARNRRHLRQRKLVADVGAGLALEGLERVIGCDQPARAVDPPDHRARFRGRASHGRSSSRSSALRYVVIRQAARHAPTRCPRRSCCRSISSRPAVAVEAEDIAASRRSGRPRSRGLRRPSEAAPLPAPNLATSILPPPSAGQCRRAARAHWQGRRFPLPPRPQATSSSSSRPAESSKATSSPVKASRLCSRSWPSAFAVATRAKASSLAAGPCVRDKVAAQRRRDPAGKPLGRAKRKIVEREQALAKPVAAPAARKHQRHCRCSDRAIVVADQGPGGLARLARPARAAAAIAIRSSSARRSSKREQLIVVEQAGIASAARSAGNCRRHWPPPSPPGAPREAHRRCRRPGNGAWPSSAPAPARSGARRGRGRSRPDGRQPSAARAARGRVRITLDPRRGAATGHSSGIIRRHYPIWVNFGSTRLVDGGRAGR